MAHEKSVTVGFRANGKRKFVNLPTVLPGPERRTVSARRAFELFKEGRLKPLGGTTFDSQEAAVDAAKRRSRNFGKR